MSTPPVDKRPVEIVDGGWYLNGPAEDPIEPVWWPGAMRCRPPKDEE